MLPKQIEMIAFVQEYALQGYGGGSRILSSLLQTDHPPVVSINTGFYPSALAPNETEIHLPLRPGFGRLEATRLHRQLGVLDQVYSARFAARLRGILSDRHIRLVHFVHHSYTIVPLSRVVRDLNLTLFLTIHDDLEYVFLGHPFIGKIREAMAEVWRSAQAVYVISDEMGEEYSRRYGAREYAVVTDGLKTVATAPLPRPAKSLRLYFMGLFHNTYAQNLRAVLDALKIVRSRHLDWEIGVTCRCGGIPVALGRDDVPVKVLPFAGEAEVQNDMLSADLLYQPMPFQQEARAFSQFSLSTKMITYLGSGLPIFYHGRDDSAACNLLRQYDAASLCTTLDPDRIAERLLHAVANRDAIVASALTLARSRFMLADQQRKFWQPILAAL